MYRFPLKQIFDDSRFRKQIFDSRFRKQIFEDIRLRKHIDTQHGGWSDLMQHRSTLATTPNSCSPCLKPLSTASTTSSEVNEPAFWTDTRFLVPFVCVCFVCCGAVENEWIGFDINKINLSLQLGSLGKICFQHREVRCRQRPRKIRLQPENKIWLNPDTTLDVFTGPDSINVRFLSWTSTTSG